MSSKKKKISRKCKLEVGVNETSNIYELMNGLLHYT